MRLSDRSAPLVRVWVTTLDRADVRWRRWLDDRELDRFGRYESPADQGRFLLGAALLRSVLGEELDLSPDEVPLDRTCPTCGRWHGRPQLQGSSYSLSVTHSGSLVAVAVGRGVEVGVDAERVRPGGPAATRSWTEAEARLKAGGGDDLVVRSLTAPLPGYLLSLATRPGTSVEVRPWESGSSTRTRLVQNGAGRAGAV